MAIHSELFEITGLGRTKNRRHKVKGQIYKWNTSGNITSGNATSGNMVGPTNMTTP